MIDFESGRISARGPRGVTMSDSPVNNCEITPKAQDTSCFPNQSNRRLAMQDIEEQVPIATRVFQTETLGRHIAQMHSDIGQTRHLGSATHGVSHRRINVDGVHGFSATPR
jgi:hypothetical protein